MSERKLQYNKVLVFALCAIALFAPPVLAIIYSDSDSGWGYTPANYRMDGNANISWNSEEMQTIGTVSSSISDPIGTATVNSTTDQSCALDDYESTWSCVDTPAYAEFYHIGPDSDGSSAWGSSSHSGTDRHKVTIGGNLEVDARP